MNLAAAMLFVAIYLCKSACMPCSFYEYTFLHGRSHLLVRIAYMSRQTIVPESLRQRSGAPLFEDLAMFLGEAWAYDVASLLPPLAAATHFWHGTGDLQARPSRSACSECGVCVPTPRCMSSDSESKSRAWPEATDVASMAPLLAAAMHFLPGTGDVQGKCFAL